MMILRGMKKRISSGGSRGAAVVIEQQQQMESIMLRPTSCIVLYIALIIIIIYQTPNDDDTTIIIITSCLSPTKAARCNGHRSTSTPVEASTRSIVSQLQLHHALICLTKTHIYTVPGRSSGCRSSAYQTALYQACSPRISSSWQKEGQMSVCMHVCMLAHTA